MAATEDRTRQEMEALEAWIDETEEELYGKKRRVGVEQLSRPVSDIHLVGHGCGEEVSGREGLRGDVRRGWSEAFQGILREI